MDTNQPFGVLKTSKSKESSISKISTLGLLACSVTLLGFRTDFAIHEFANLLSLLYTSQCTLSATARKVFVLWNWKELPLSQIVSNVCQFLPYKTG